MFFQRLLLAAPLPYRLQLHKICQFLGYVIVVVSTCHRRGYRIPEPPSLMFKSAHPELCSAVSPPTVKTSPLSTQDILRVSKPLNICGLISLLPPLSSSVKSLVPAKFLKDHSYSQSAKMPKMQLHLQSCHLVPVCRGRGASLAAHLISMSIMMVQPGPSPKLNELPLLERGNQI